MELELGLVLAAPDHEADEDLAVLRMRALERRRACGLRATADGAGGVERRGCALRFRARKRSDSIPIANATTSNTAARDIERESGHSMDRHTLAARGQIFRER